MNGRNGTLSPVSTDSASNDWSPVSRYQNLGSDNPYSPSVPPSGFGSSFGPPPPSAGRPIHTPPASSHNSAGIPPDGPGPMPPRSNGNPSPPSSIARSSDGTGLYASSIGETLNGRKALVMEEALAEHYRVLKVYLSGYLADEKGNPRPNRARDKLLRLSVIQFQELSTDVYDESQRREDEIRRGLESGVPKFLPPKNNFHPKRNQARQKLSTLPLERFRQLATDVFYELERRFPHFTGDNIERTASPALSTASSTRSGPGRRPPPGGLPPGGFRGPPPGGRGQPPFRNGSMGGSANLGPPGAGGSGDFGRPLPKQFQQNTIVPNKGTLVEDDDDQSGDDDEDDDQDAFGLEGAAQRRSRRTTNKSLKSVKSVGGRDDKAIAEFQQQVDQLQEKIDSLNTELREKDEEIDKLRSAHKSLDETHGNERNEWSDLRYELEKKLSDAQDLNENLESELRKARDDNASVERNLRAELENARQQNEQAQQQYRSSAGSGDGEWRQRYNELERDFNEQQQVTEDVRREAEQFLQEMRVLSERSDQAMEKEERLAQQVIQLETEVKDWKSRYARAKTQVRSTRTSSMGLSVQSPDISNYTSQGNSQIDGIVKDVHMTKFQLAIDELLQTARRADGEAVLESMKNVVLCVRKITADVDAADAEQADSPGGHSDDVAQQHAKLKGRVSATANNLITASKNHASAVGLAPVSLLDAAASHLSMAVVELVKVVRIRASAPGELDDEDYDNGVKPLPSKGYLSLSNGFGHMRARSKGGSDSTGYSGSSSPRRLDGWASRRSESVSALNGNGMRQASNPGMNEFKEYLDDETAVLVQNIQPLVQSVRSKPMNVYLPPEEEAAVINYISQITRSVQDTAQRTQNAINSLGDDALARHAPPVVGVLQAESQKLLDAGSMNDDDWREQVPPLAFKIARTMKELVLRVERIETGELTASQPVSNDF